MSLSRKRKKELRRLQENANQLWVSQQALIGQAGTIAREAGRQLGQLNREQVVPAVQDTYVRRIQPQLDRGVRFSRNIVDNKVVPAVGGVIGSALSAWDVANAKRHGLPVRVAVPEPKKGLGIGSIIAIVLGAAAAAGVLFAAWQALRADDELWVADDPLNAPEA